MDQYLFAVEGLSSLGDFDKLPQAVKMNAVRAINDAAEYARSEGARIMRAEIAFPDTYLDPSQGRFTLASRANTDTLQAVVRGSHDAVSLARFSSGGKRGDHVAVGVVRGKGRVMTKRAFIMPLRNGNQGLAIRMKKGETLAKSTGAVEVASGLYLLYGPSVDQAFARVLDGNESGFVSRVGDRMEQEFIRLMGVFS